MLAVNAQGLSKYFRVYEKPSDHLKEIFTLNRCQFHSPFWAVRDVDFEIEPGDCLGIIGENGSGKTNCHKAIY